MKKVMLLASLVIALSACTTPSSEINSTSVPAQAKSNVQHFEGLIKGYETKEFTFYAQEGQTLNISMATRFPVAYFNIFAPNSDDAMFNSSINGEQFEGIVEKTGEYKISVYQMRASARRNKIAQYRLEIISN